MSPKNTEFTAFSTKLFIICLLLGGFAQAATAQISTKFVAEDSSFTKKGNQITINWRTEYEINTIGFHVWREIKNEKTRVTPELIAGSLLQTGQNAALPAGNSYAWTDVLPKGIGKSELADLTYWIEEIGTDNRSFWHGASARKIGTNKNFGNGKKSLSISGLNRINVKPLDEFETHFPAFELQNASKTGLENSALSPSEQQIVLANNPKAVKLSVSHDGLYRVERSQLASYGIDSLAERDFLSLFVDGEEQSLAVNADGSIEFYGRGTTDRFTKNRVYWLAVNTQRGKRISSDVKTVENNHEIAATNPVTNFLDVTMRRDRKVFANTILNGETENFFGAIINAAGLMQTLSVINPTANGEKAVLEVTIQGLTNGQHDIRVQLNGIELGAVTFDNQEYASKQFTVAASSLINGANVLTFADKLPGTNLIDYARLTYARDLKAVKNKLNFSIAANQSARITGFSSSDIRFLDITNPSNTRRISVASQNKENDSFSFTIAASDAPRKIIALKSNSYDVKLKLGANDASQLKTVDNAADFVIIAHRNFLTAAAPLKTLRESQGLKTQIIDVENVYDEFSYGIHTPRAIHDFLLYAKQNWATKPRYVLFIGDSTNDPRNYLGRNIKNFVPTYAADGYYGEGASDTEMTNLNDDDGFEALEEIAFGRLSVRMQTEAQNAVKKILDYENRPTGDTVQRGIILLSDNFDGYNFEDLTNQIRDFLPTNMPQKIINRRDGSSSAVRAGLITAINDGAGIINFMGHGSSFGWTSANLLNTNDAPNLTNNPRQSFVVALACLNGSFLENQDTFAETMVKTPNGGAVAMLASSGLTLPFGQVIAIEKLYDVILFGNEVRLGDAVRQAKAANTDLDVRRLMILFGDPTMRIK